MYAESVRPTSSPRERTGREGAVVDQTTPSIETNFPPEEATTVCDDPCWRLSNLAFTVPLDRSYSENPSWLRITRELRSDSMARSSRPDPGGNGQEPICFGGS